MSHNISAPDNLVISDQLARNMTLKSGQVLTRGAALGRITSGGQVKQLDSTQSDGSQTPYGVLAEDCDATDGDTNCLVYVRGVFNDRSVGFVTGQVAATFYDGFRDVGIYLKGSASLETVFPEGES
jgi:hypothetical protein